MIKDAESTYASRRLVSVPFRYRLQSLFPVRASVFCGQRRKRRKMLKDIGGRRCVCWRVTGEEAGTAARWNTLFLRAVISRSNPRTASTRRRRDNGNRIAAVASPRRGMIPYGDVTHCPRGDIFAGRSTREPGSDCSVADRPPSRRLSFPRRRS